MVAALVTYFEDSWDVVGDAGDKFDFSEGLLEASGRHIRG